MDKASAVAALAALAQDTRLEIFRLLVEAGAAGLPAGRIGERFGLPSATLSFHLAQLRHSGLVRSRRESRLVIYVARFETMGALLAFLTRDCCHGHPEICAPMVEYAVAACTAACAPESPPKAARSRRRRPSAADA